MATRSGLVATFNSAFKLQDSGGGFAYDGHTYAPMKPNTATILRYRDGRVDVISWHGGPGVPANVVYARQNLPLIVNRGRPNPNLSDGPEWGATLGNAIMVWRSAVGVDRHGNLIYAAANDQTVGSLAAIMIRAGAVRAMELDINTYWTSFITYRYPGAGRPGEPARRHGPLPDPVPDARRPGLLRRVRPVSLESSHRPAGAQGAAGGRSKRAHKRMASPSREAIERYEARILAYERSRESRGNPRTSDRRRGSDRVRDAARFGSAHDGSSSSPR